MWRYYKGAGACVIAFSTVDRASFDAIDKWSAKVDFFIFHVALRLMERGVGYLGSQPPFFLPYSANLFL